MMGNIVDYRIVVEPSGRAPEELAAKVRALLAEGWEPNGGVISDGYVMMQAMVLREG